MKLVLKLTAAFVIAVLAGCGVNNSTNINFDPKNIQYTRDSRTGICYAYTASRKAVQFSTSGLGITKVDCTDEVLRLVN